MDASHGVLFSSVVVVVVVVSGRAMRGEEVVLRDARQATNAVDGAAAGNALFPRAERRFSMFEVVGRTGRVREKNR